LTEEKSLVTRGRGSSKLLVNLAREEKMHWARGKMQKKGRKGEGGKVE